MLACLLLVLPGCRAQALGAEAPTTPAVVNGANGQAGAVRAAAELATWDNVTPSNANRTEVLYCGNCGTAAIQADPMHPNLYALQMSTSTIRWIVGIMELNPHNQTPHIRRMSIPSSIVRASGNPRTMALHGLAQSTPAPTVLP